MRNILVCDNKPGTALTDRNAVGGFGHFLGQEGVLHRRFMEVEKDNQRLLEMHSSILARHEALTGYITRQNSIIWDSLKNISERLDSVLILIDGLHASQPTQPVHTHFPGAF